MIDLVVLATLVLASATFVTVHVATAFGVARRRSMPRAIAAFFVPPLAPYFAFREQMRVRAILWCGSLVLYVVAHIVGR